MCSFYDGFSASLLFLCWIQYVHFQISSYMARQIFYFIVQNSQPYTKKSGLLLFYNYLHLCSLLISLLNFSKIACGKVYYIQRCCKGVMHTHWCTQHVFCPFNIYQKTFKNIRSIVFSATLFPITVVHSTSEVDIDVLKRAPRTVNWDEGAFLLSNIWDTVLKKSDCRWRCCSTHTDRKAAQKICVNQLTTHVTATSCDHAEEGCSTQQSKLSGRIKPHLV